MNTNYAGIGNYGLDASGYGGTGAFPTPSVMGNSIAGFGASNPVGSYLSSPNFQANTTAGQFFGYTPQGNGPGGYGGLKLGPNLGTLDLAVRGIGTIGSLWQAWEANKLAKQQFAFQKNVTNANMANQIQAYNTTLEDRARSRYHTEGTPEMAQGYVEKNRLQERQL